MVTVPFSSAVITVFLEVVTVHGPISTLEAASHGRLHNMPLTALAALSENAASTHVKLRRQYGRVSRSVLEECHEVRAHAEMPLLAPSTISPELDVAVVSATSNAVAMERRRRGRFVFGLHGQG